MVKVIIADDEKMIRTLIKDSLPIEELDILLLAEADNGNEALEQSLRLIPDILITDIRMPGLSGLDLIERLVKYLPDMIIIIISGYNDFEYARRALSLGVFNYLLKPIDRAEIHRVLKQAKDRIESKKDLQHKVNKSISLSQEIFLNNVISSNNFILDTSDEVLKQSGVILDSDPFRLILISIDGAASLLKNSSLIEKQRLLSGLKRISKRFAKHYFRGIAITNNNVEGELIILYSSKECMDKAYIQQKMTILKKIFYRHTGISLSTGISTLGTGVENISQLYSEAQNALSYRMIAGKGSINFFEDLSTMESSDFNISKNLVDEVILNIELLSTENVLRIIDYIFTLISTRKFQSPSIIKARLLEFVVEVLVTLNCKSYFICSSSQTTSPLLYEEFGKASSFEELNKYLKTIFNDIINNRISELRSTPNNTIEMAKTYIKENYFKDIQLDMIANYVFLNATYFSQLFKKETGQNFSEFLSFVRIEKAKVLLKNTNYKVYEICEKVGYSDTKHFTKLFRRLTGMSPSEYKEQ